MVDEVTGRKNQNEGDRFSFTQIDKTDPANNLDMWVRRVLAYITQEHFEEITRAAFTSTKPKIVEVDMPNNAIEYSYEFPVGVKQIEIIPTSQARITYSYELGGTVAPESIENDRFVPWEEKFLNLDEALKIYMKSEVNSTKVKIKYWT